MREDTISIEEIEKEMQEIGVSVPGSRKKKETEEPEINDCGSGHYRRTVRRFSLLTPEEEVKYSRAVSAGRKAGEKLKDAGLTPSAKAELESVVEAGKKAKEILIYRNLRLVEDIAKKFNANLMTNDDLMQEGTIGLMTAVDKFDESRGYRFSTYAFYWIKQAVCRAIEVKDRLVRYPAHVHQSVLRYNKFCTSFEVQNGRRPADSEAADKLRIPVEEAARLRALLELPCSLNAYIGDDEDSELGDFIEDTTSLNPEDEYIKLEQNKVLNKAMKNVLSEKERRVIIMRFGLNGAGARTLQEVGDTLGFSRERARQVENDALRKLNLCMRKEYGSFVREYLNKDGKGMDECEKCS